MFVTMVNVSKSVIFQKQQSYSFWKIMADHHHSGSPSFQHIHHDTKYMYG
jgi:hypothetical protein